MKYNFRYEGSFLSRNIFDQFSDVVKLRTRNRIGTKRVETSDTEAIVVSSPSQNEIGKEKKKKNTKSKTDKLSSR